MRYNLSLVLLFISIALFSQPANNECNGLIDLGTAPFCDETIYENIGATPFDISFENEPNCFVDNPPQNDVWFSFMSNDEDEDYIVIISGVDDGQEAPISSIQAAVYRGDCQVDGLAVFKCAAGGSGEQKLSFTVEGLTPSTQYFIRVDNFGGDGNEGNFNLCVETSLNEALISEGGSTACSGILYDSGGPDGDYGNSENHIFTICPDEFHQCVTFNLEYYNIQSTIDDFFEGDFITFYDGDDTNAPQITELGTDLFNFFDAGGGGVCFTVQASNCLTIQFTSDSQIAFEGFKGFWECSISPCENKDQVEVGSIPSKEQIEQVLSTVAGNVTLDTIICPEGAYALFSGGNSTDLGIDQGIILTSGTAHNSIGPNVFGDTSFEHFEGGDSDLDILSNIFGDGSESGDACVIEVDVVALSNTLSFEYIFASEEYPEFANTQWNDIFALLISGPGIDGEPMLNNQKNMAIIPGSETPVEINTINNLVNWEYYRNNMIGQSLEYDGITSDKFGIKKSLTAVSTVEPCGTYHLKFAIADRSDVAWDSGVFISEINTGAPTLAFNFESGLDYLTENCTVGPNFLEIRLSEPLQDTFNLNVGQNTFEISGTAERGMDYTITIPDTLRFLPGETLLSIPIEVISDGLQEGSETFIFTITNTECGDIQVATIEGFISDEITIDITGTDNDTISVCRGDSLTLMATGGNTYVWSPTEHVSDPTIASPTVDTDTSRWYYVIGSIEGNPDPSCIGADSVFVMVNSTSIEIIPRDTTSFCEGENIRVDIETDGNPSTIVWEPSEGILDVPGGGYVITPDTTSLDGLNYVVTISGNKCEGSDTLTLFVEPFVFPSHFHADTTICQGDSIRLAEQIDGVTTIYSWTPVDSLSDPASSGTIAYPSDTTTYQLIAMSPSGNCADTAEVLVNVIPNFVRIIPEDDTILLCKGDSILLNSASSSNGEGLEWFPSNILSDSTLASVWAKPDVSTMVYLQLEGDVCSAIDSALIRVDSLPNLAIEAIPFREKYCMGEIVTLISPGYDEDLYPYIEHFWTPPLGVQTDLSELNLAFAAVDTTFYVRQTINGACISNDSILINVVVPNLMLNLSDTTVCPGEPVDVLLTAPQFLENISWSPGDANVISCTDCPNPTMTVFQTTTFSVSADADDCPSGASLTINVAGGFNVAFNADPGFTVGLGADVTITANISPDPGPNTEYTWFVNGQIISGQTGLTATFPVLEEINEVVIEWVDEFGCPRSAVVTVFGEAPKIVFPNAFTPGPSPDINDNYTPWFNTIANLEINNFFIYNRWGEKVFDCADWTCFEEGWDGMHKDKKAPSGVYMFVFNYTLPNGEKETAKGNITLIR